MTTKNKDILYTPGSQAPTNGDPLSYAQWLYGKSVYDAEQMRLQADKQAETDRQRAIVDANSAYQQGRATYGANAEAVAGMGLSGSGYGEYLTGKAYATQRGEVQNANVTAQARKDQALYEENSAKTQAAQIYANDLIGIKNQQTADYGALYDAATQGTSIEALMQDGRWASLTADQRSAIRQITSANSLKAQLDGGASLDDLRAGNSWTGLTVDAQQQLTNYYNTITSAKKAESEKNFTTYLDGINSGAYTLEDLKSLDGYANLSKEQRERLQNAYNDITDGIYNTYLNGIKDGTLTLEQIKADSAYKRLSPTLQGSLEYEAWKAKPAKEQSEKEDNALLIGSLMEEYGEGWDTAEDVKQTLYGLGYTKDERDSIVASWQEKKLEMLKSMSVLSQTTIDDAVKNGLVSPEGAKTLKPTATTDKDALQSGKISSETYIAGTDSKSASGGEVNGGWSISGLGTGKSGGKGDHFTLNLGIGNKSGNKTTYKLVTDGVITDQQKIKQLNALATGNANQTPSAKNDSWLGGVHSSIENAGKIVVYEGELYLYTKKGWCNVAGDGINVNDAVADFLSRRK